MNRSRLLIFGDSFLRLSLKFFVPYFRDILYVRSASFQEDIATLYQPDAIITGNVERYLMQVDRDTEAESFLLSQLNSSDYASDDRHQPAFNAQLSIAFTVPRMIGGPMRWMLSTPLRKPSSCRSRIWSIPERPSG